MSIRTASRLLAALLALPVAALAEPGFSVRNEALLSRSFALPTLGEARVLDAGAYATRFTLDWSNEYVARGNARETLVIDGETQRLTFGFRRGLSEGVELTVDIPLLTTGGGVLDGPIQSWHDVFGLPNGGREFATDDRFGVQYVVDGNTRLDVRDTATRFGDIELGLGFRLREDFAFRALAKLPSGRSSRLQGGNAGTAVWFDFDPFLRLGLPGWFGYVSGGVSYNAQPDVLGAQAQPFVALGGVGAGYRVWAPVSLIVQFNVHSPLYDDSALGALTRPGGQLAFGGRIDLAPSLQMDIGVQEDVLVSSSPDFSIHIGLRFRP